MKKSFLVTFVVGSLFVTSCTEDVYNPERIKEDYAQNFVELFGEINPNQDWNVAELKSVTVNPGSSTEVQIYANAGDIYKLVGNYHNVVGKQTLKFDAAKNVNDFLVSVGGKGKLAKNGDEVSFADASTRTYESDVDNVFTKLTEYKQFSWQEVTTITNKLREDRDNTDVRGIKRNFIMQKKPGEIINVYPIYWNAMYHHTVGIFWEEDGELKEVDVYTDKVGDDLQVFLEKKERQEGDWWERPKYSWEDYGWVNANNNSNDRNERGYASIALPVGYDNDDFRIKQNAGFQSRGFTIELPDYTQFGFYIKVYDTRNKLIDTYYTNRYKNGKAGEMASYFTDNQGRAFLGFEDQYSRGAKKDLNDLMLIIDPAPSTIVEPEPEPDPDPDPEPEPTPEATTWIIAAEDLGETDDYDFNDVVFSVTHTSGETTATITPLAAGGSLETYVSYKGTRINDGKEFHSWFGDDYKANADGTYGFINTQTSGNPGESFTITVDKDFTMSTNDDQLGESMGGFSITVGENTITAPKSGATPQMICVPADWKWPVERINIKDAYSQFSNWVNDPTVEWYNEPVSGKVIE